jgi:hypothetical protein
MYKLFHLKVDILTLQLPYIHARIMLGEGGSDRGLVEKWATPTFLSS